MTKYAGRKITIAWFDEERSEVRLTFDDGVTIRIRDNGQSCCEMRYMRTDDNLQDLVGKKLTSIEIKAGPRTLTDYDVHEVAFLEIQAEDAVVTFSTHNEHNGYYGGFAIKVEEV